MMWAMAPLTTRPELPCERLRVVPFPHSTPERLVHYAPRDAAYLLTA